MDKNGWMSSVVPIMGFEKTEHARSLCNRDRQHRINSLQVRPNYENPTAKKARINPEYHNTISGVMSEKLRIRKKRQDLNARQGPATARTLERDTDPLLVENIEDSMAKTNMDFYSTTSSFYPRGGGTTPNERRSLSRDV